jgi:hypothetical protein
MRMRSVCGERRIAIKCSNQQHCAQHMRKPTPQQGFPAGRLLGICFSIMWYTHENTTFQKSVPSTGLKFDRDRHNFVRYKELMSITDKYPLKYDS